MDCWATLTIERTVDKREIKRAYAKLVKQFHPEEDPKGFQTIREAYDQALAYADYATATRHEPDTIKIDTPVVSELSAEDARSDHAPITEKSAVLERQIQAVDGAIEKLIASLRTSEVQAIDFCRETLHEEFFQAFDVRYEFEGRLLKALVEANLYSFALLEYMAQAFDWDIDIYRKDGIVKNHFGQDFRFSGLFLTVMQPYVADLIRRAMRNNLRPAYPALGQKDFDDLDTVLFGDIREEELERYVKGKDQVQLIRTAYGFLTYNGFVSEHRSLIGLDRLNWLIDKGIVDPHQPPKVHQSAPAPAQDSHSTFPRWALWVLAFILLRVVMAAFSSNNSSHTYVPESSQSKTIPDIYAFSREKMEHIQFLQEGAKRGDASAQYQLAQEYLKSDVLSRDPKKAYTLLQEAYRQGYVPAATSLGILYYTGEGGTIDYPFAVELLNKGVEANSAEAAYWMSRAYSDGKGVSKSTAKANKYLDRAIELGSTAAIRSKAARLIQNGKADAVASGIALLKDAADHRDDPYAIYDLAFENLSGQHIPKDYAEASRLLLRLSNRHIPIAELWLSQLYDKGLGVPQDSAGAKKIITRIKQLNRRDTLNEFSWSLATFPNDELRNGALAVSLMESLLMRPWNVDAYTTDTLAAAYAATGNFDKAVEEQQRALNLLPTDADEDRRNYAARLNLYRKHEAYVTK